MIMRCFVLFFFCDRNRRFNPGLYQRARMLRASVVGEEPMEMAIPLHLLHEFW